MVGYLLAFGIAVLVGRILYEETILTWTSGPQMVGFAMMHGAVPFILVAGLIGLAGGLLWVAGSLVLLFRRRFQIPIVAWVPTILVPALAAFLFIPYVVLEEITVQIAGPGIHGDDFMIQAAVYGKQRFVTHLLRKGYDINYEDRGGTSPLSAAAVMGNEGMVSFLIAEGADVNRKSRLSGGTPLMAAAETGKIRTVNVLLENGSDPCATNIEGHTAAGLAKKYGHGDIADYLSSRFRCQEKVVDSCADPSVSACVHP